MSITDKPIYVHSAALAYRLGVTRSAISNWITRKQTKILLPPDAYLTDGSPLWSETSMKIMAATYQKRTTARIETIEKNLHNE